MDNPKSLFTSLKNRIGFFPLFLIFLLVVLLIFYSLSTKWIPTTSRINETDASNRTVELEGIYSYAYNDYIVKEKNFEEHNTQIPKGSLEPEKAFLLIVLILVLVIILVSKKEKRVEPAKKEEVEEVAKIYIDSLKENRKITDGKVLPQGALHRRQTGDGKLEPNLWMIPVNYEMNDGDYEYHLLFFEPYSIQLFEDRKLIKEFKGEDRCYKCGMYSDLKVLRPNDLKIMDDLFGWAKKH